MGIHTSKQLHKIAKIVSGDDGVTEAFASCLQRLYEAGTITEEQLEGWNNGEWSIGCFAESGFNFEETGK